MKINRAYMIIYFICFSLLFSAFGCNEKENKVDNKVNDKKIEPATEKSQPAGESSAQVYTGRDGVDMVYVPAGVFYMGDNDAATFERPRMNVFIDAYYIDRFEISNERFAAFVKESGYKPHGAFSFSEKLEFFPARKLTWRDASEYCKWAGKRLPTEYEWEKAARGIDGRKWPWGNSEIKPAVEIKWNVITEDPLGQSPYGCLHMADNVWEWTDSWFAAYALSEDANSDYGEKFKVVRGGTVAGENKSAGYAKTTMRRYMKPETSDDATGARCARDP